MKENTPDLVTLRRLGISLVLVGLFFLFSQYINTGWLSFFVFGSFLLIESVLAFVKKAALGFMVSIFSLCINFGSLLILLSENTETLIGRIGFVTLLLGLVFLFMCAFQYCESRKAGWWAFFIGWSLLFISIPFIRNELNLLRLTLWISLGVGSGFLIWGLGQRLLGLIITGCLLSSIGFGIYSGWNQIISTNGLTETGIMLVWFGLGWGSITIISRLRMRQYLGWPLIPAGILGVVGWGLYSGGDPNNALSFIGNTGALGVLIFGLYFLLMRRGIKS